MRGAHQRVHGDQSVPRSAVGALHKMSVASSYRTVSKATKVNAEEAACVIFSRSKMLSLCHWNSMSVDFGFMTDRTRRA
jgi:hypothetical protein